MDETLAQILDACKSAEELKENLATTQNHPLYLLNSCLEIVGAFDKAIRSIRSLYPSLTSGVGSPFGEEGSSHGGSRMREVNILQSQALEEANNPFFNRGPGETTPIGLPQLGPEIQMPAVMLAPTPELRGAPGYIGGPQPEVEPFRSNRAEGAGPSGLGRRPAGSSGQRSSRRRGRGEETTVRVPALRTGNMELPPDDGYTWRKYGQKNILGSRFPRSYYRCTHRNFYGCEAKKRVQRLDDDPYNYEVTYCGQHSCLTSTAPLLLHSLPLPTAPASPAAAPFPGGGGGRHNVNSPRGAAAAAAASLAEAVTIAGQTSPLSTSIQLGSWLLHGLEGGSSHAGTSQVQGGGGRDAECPVTDLADTMFNSGSSGSIDAIFDSTRKDN